MSSGLDDPFGEWDGDDDPFWPKPWDDGPILPSQVDEAAGDGPVDDSAAPGESALNEDDLAVEEVVDVAGKPARALRHRACLPRSPPVSFSSPIPLFARRLCRL